jgi:hypothetical protein
MASDEFKAATRDAIKAVGDALVIAWARMWLARNERERAVDGGDVSLATEEAIAMLCKHVLSSVADGRIGVLQAALAEALDEWQGHVGPRHVARIEELRLLL